MNTTLVLFDFNNLACRCVHLSGMQREGKDSWGLVTYTIFNIIQEFLGDLSAVLEPEDRIETVLALDSRHGYWRSQIYPPYKANRKEKRKEDDIDWERAFQEFARLSQALARYTPWKVLEVPTCEADDLIFTLAKEHEGSVVIHSGDSDYLQLVSDEISLFQPQRKDYVEFPMVCKISGGEVLCRSAEEYLNYAILTGQGGKDNVYNVKTPTDWDASQGKRKPGFGVAAAKKVLDVPDWQGELQRLGLWENYLHNKSLIDMRELPEELRVQILEVYRQIQPGEVKIEVLADEFDWPSVRGDALNYNTELASHIHGTMEKEKELPEQDCSALGSFSL